MLKQPLLISATVRASDLKFLTQLSLRNIMSNTTLKILATVTIFIPFLRSRVNTTHSAYCRLSSAS